MSFHLAPASCFPNVSAKIARSFYANVRAPQACLSFLMSSLWIAVRRQQGSTPLQFELIGLLFFFPMLITQISHCFHVAQRFPPPQPSGRFFSLPPPHIRDELPARALPAAALDRKRFSPPTHAKPPFFLSSQRNPPPRHPTPPTSAKHQDSMPFPSPPPTRPAASPLPPLPPMRAFLYVPLDSRVLSKFMRLFPQVSVGVPCPRRSFCVSESAALATEARNSPHRCPFFSPFTWIEWRPRHVSISAILLPLTDAVL